MPRRMVFDRWLFFTATLLVVGGSLMVGSASNFVAMRYGRDPSAFWLRHAIHLTLGVTALIAALYLPYRLLGRRAVVFSALGAAFGSLVWVLFTAPIAHVHRWISIAGTTVQPSEPAKLAAVLFMAYMLARHEDRLRESLEVPLTCLAVVGTLAVLVLVEPDLGSAVVLVSLAAAMIFAAGLGWKQVAAGAALAGVALAVGVALEPYRRERMRGFVRTLVEPTAVSGRDSGFQLEQSLIAIGSGGVTGLGLGNGLQKAYYVPEVHTDFIYSVVGEELGLLGTLGLLGAYALVFWRGTRAARGAPDAFGYYLALGMTLLIVLPALLNIAVCVGLAPTTGLTLPFVSYGGSSLVTSLAAMGLLINVSQHSN